MSEKINDFTQNSACKKKTINSVSKQKLIALKTLGLSSSCKSGFSL